MLVVTVLVDAVNNAGSAHLPPHKQPAILGITDEPAARPAGASLRLDSGSDLKAHADGDQTKNDEPHDSQELRDSACMLFSRS